MILSNTIGTSTHIMSIEEIRCLTAAIHDSYFLEGVYNEEMHH